MRSAATHPLEDPATCLKHGVVVGGVQRHSQRCACVEEVDRSWGGVDCSVATFKCLSPFAPAYDHCSNAGEVNTRLSSQSKRSLSTIAQTVHIDRQIRGLLVLYAHACVLPM